MQSTCNTSKPVLPELVVVVRAVSVAFSPSPVTAISDADVAGQPQVSVGAPYTTIAFSDHVLEDDCAYNVTVSPSLRLVENPGAVKTTDWSVMPVSPPFCRRTIVNSMPTRRYSKI
jgi:hypothetical protein